MKVYLQTFGCKVNTAESESIAELLIREGWQITEELSQADAIVINSCTVTASGDKRMFQALRKIRKNAPDAVILLTGCYVQAFPKDAAELPEVDIMIGTKNRSRIPELLQAYLQNPHRISAVETFVSGESFESLPHGADASHTRAFLKIQDGCNRFCSYCIIPYARGRCRSRDLDEIKAESRILVEQGYHEIVLCGINLACYRQDQRDLADAVKAVAESGINQIRLGSLEPDGLTDDILQRISQIPELLPHFHISVQSGCDKILKAMHRHYISEEYERLIMKIRELFPGCAVTTDIMTGFPGETELDFSETLAFVKRVKFAEIHVFRYSQRPGTQAADMAGQISEKIKKERADRLIETATALRESYLQSCIGQIHKVLFERQKNPDFHNGHADNYAVVLVPAKPGEQFRNQIFDVEITGREGGALTGKLL